VWQESGSAAGELKIMRTSNLFRTAGALALALVLVLMPSMLEASPNTTAAQTISLSYTLSETLSLTLGTTSATFIQGTPGAAAIASPFSVSATWSLNGNRSEVDIVGYFSSTNALTAGSQNIPTSNIWSTETGGASACNGNWTTVNGFANACLFYQNTSPGINGTGSANVTLSIPASAFTSMNLTPATFTGSLNVVAQAI
jgi:hypothetical protein